jgi:hypothetical protein
MQVQAVKRDQGWLIRDLPGFEAIKANYDDQYYKSDQYKEERGAYLMEKYK